METMQEVKAAPRSPGSGKGGDLNAQLALAGQIGPK